MAPYIQIGESPEQGRQKPPQNRQKIQEPRTSTAQTSLQKARDSRTSVQQTQEPRRLNPAQHERTGQDHIPRSTLPAVHAIHSSSRSKHA
jgi:hypothetical protein